MCKIIFILYQAYYSASRSKSNSSSYTSGIPGPGCSSSHALLHFSSSSSLNYSYSSGESSFFLSSSAFTLSS